MTDWAIPQQAKLKYTQLFNLHDRSHSGFLSGLQCRDILLQSGLPRNVLAEIWNLSDIDGDGQLTREEFILAMHLTNNVRSGQNLPSELSKELIPPSYRRQRSISATSVQSTNSNNSSVTSGNINSNSNNKSNLIDELSTVSSASATTHLSGTTAATTTQDSTSVIGSLTANSVFNANSFENKRRENFEKGRAELERRRLKIIEQQTSILKEQLVSSRKLVSEAKGKIDTLRADRDTKMGMITFLEAQLKTLQDKKVYLNQEEQSLMAIAKDLNLVNAAQMELDQLATQAKQESINQMKVQLEKMASEKEAKSSQLLESTQRLEDSKKRLKMVSEQVGKTYEIYKEKVAEAKIKREQFLAESKAQTVNLDSVWTSNPVATTITAASNQAQFDQQAATTTNNAFSFNEDPWAISSTKPSANFDLDDTKPFSFNDDFSANFAKNVDPCNNNELDLKSSPSPTVALGSSKKVKKYRALYAFEARNPDELTINPGDIIVGSEEVCEPGWLSGEIDSRVGLFPETYVEPLAEFAEFPSNDDFSEQINIENKIPSSERQEQSAISLSTTIPGETKQTGHSSMGASGFALTSSNKRYKVLYAFEARNLDELTIKPGDIIIGLDDVTEPGWLSGQLDGQKGLFPEAYVEPITETEQETQPEPTGKSRAKKAEVATVIANYRALGQEQLNLEKGQLVLIRRKMDSGWWEGEIQIKGKKKQYGWFPASYIKLLSNNSNNSKQVEGSGDAVA